LCDLAEVSYTGCPAATLSLARDKAATQRLLRGAGVRTAEFFVVERDDERWLDKASDWVDGQAWIVKPASEDASLGLSQSSVVLDRGSLQREVEAVRARFGRVLVERYIDGREFNVAVMDAPEPTALPLAEIEFHPNAAARWKLITYDAKWSPDSPDWRATPVSCPAQVEPALAAELERSALASYSLLGCRDYARIDLRVDEFGSPYVLEVNPNPDLSPEAGFARALAASGRSYAEFACSLVDRAARRRSRARSRPALASNPIAAFGAGGDLRLRELRPDDVETLVRILVECAVFRPDEVEVGREVLSEAASAGVDGHYQVRVVELDGRAAGWACFGRVPMTDRTWDLYWIAVHPSAQGRGVGARLLRECELDLAQRGARWLLAETSGSEIYRATRAFYVQRGYAVLGEVPDFYGPADGRVLFGKRLDVPSAAPSSSPSL